MVEGIPPGGGLVREEKDWTLLYDGCLDTSAIISVVNGEEQVTDGPSIKSSPVRRSASVFSSKQISPKKMGRKPPLGLRPGNDWKQRLNTVHKTSHPMKTIRTDSGGVMVIPIKRGRGRPPKNAPSIQATEIANTIYKNNHVADQWDFTIERPIHYLHQNPQCDNHEFDLFKTDTSYCSDDPMLTVDYDMDEQDFVWLKQWNDERRTTGLVRIAEDDFEYCMDRLEKYWFNLTKAYQKWHSIIEDSGSPEDYACEICGDGETTSTNLIVMCDGCDLAVHQDCYGVVHIPEGPWLCRRCYVGGESNAHCALCPWPDGALKQTTDPKRPWAHLICAHYLPNENSILNPAFQEPIEVKHLNGERANLTCIYCRRKAGAPIQCYQKTCHLAFHPLCARKAGALIDHSKQSGLCWKHSVGERREHDTDEDHHIDVESITSPRIRKNSFGPMPPVPFIEIPSTVSSSFRKKRPKSKPSWLMEPIAPRIILDRILESYPVIDNGCSIVDLDSIACISRYWSLKRSSKRGLPLLRRLQFEPWSTSSFNVGDPKAIKANRFTREYILKDLQRLEGLCSNLVRSERNRLESFTCLRDSISLALDPCTILSRLILRTAISLDPNGLFAAPVSVEDVPDYLDIIQEPMDFHTMAVKLESDAYTSFDDFVHDLDLISQNSMTYNMPETIYYQTAESLRDQIESLVLKVRKTLKELRLKNFGQVNLNLLKMIRPCLPQVEDDYEDEEHEDLDVEKEESNDDVEDQINEGLPTVCCSHDSRVWALISPGVMYPGRCVGKAMLSKKTRQQIPPVVYSQKLSSSIHLVQFYNNAGTWTVVNTDEVRQLTEEYAADVESLKNEGFKVKPDSKLAHSRANDM